MIKKNSKKFIGILPSRRSLHLGLLMIVGGGLCGTSIGYESAKAETSCIPSGPKLTRQELVARSAGILNQVHVAEEAKVTEGTLIISLDDRLVALGLKEAQAALDMARISEKLARDAFERIKKLKGGDSISQQQIVESSLKLSQARAGVAQAEAQVERLKIQLADSQIRAEVAGVVRGLPSVKGLFVQFGQSLGYIEVDNQDPAGTTAPCPPK